MIEFAVAGLSDPVQATVPWLSLSILVPIGGALLIPFIPDQGEGKQIRWYALIVTLITFLITVAGYLTGYDPSLSGLQLFERVSWLPEIGLTWTVGADGLSMPLILLTSFITSLACLAAWPVTFKPRLFFFLLLAMDGGQIAVFAVQDMLLFFLAWELELLPVYLLLAIWGGKKRQYAATKFILYTAGSSLFILLAALGHGVFRRRNAKFRIHGTGCKGLWEWLPVALLRGTADCLRSQASDRAAAYLAARCPRRSNGTRAHAARWHPPKNGWLCPAAIQL